MSGRSRTGSADITLPLTTHAGGGREADSGHIGADVLGHLGKHRAVDLSRRRESIGEFLFGEHRRWVDSWSDALRSLSAPLDPLTGSTANIYVVASTLPNAIRAMPSLVGKPCSSCNR